MNKNVLTLIGIIAICGTVLMVVDKQTSQSIEAPPQAKATFTSKSNKSPVFDGYTFILTGDNNSNYYLKNESGNILSIKYSREQYGIEIETRSRDTLFGGIVRVEIKNKPTRLDRVYVNIADCKNGYGILYIKNMSYETVEDADWANGVNSVPSAIAQFICNLEQEQKLNQS